MSDDYYDVKKILPYYLSHLMQHQRIKNSCAFITLHNETLAYHQTHLILMRHRIALHHSHRRRRRCHLHY